MTVSIKKKASNAAWDKKNMATIACRLRSEEAEAFKKYAQERGKSPHALLKEFVFECIAEKGAVD